MYVHTDIHRESQSKQGKSTCKKKGKEKGFIGITVKDSTRIIKGDERIMQNRSVQGVRAENTNILFNKPSEESQSTISTLQERKYIPAH